MTLKIKNIWYDHATESRTYPQGVLTVDSDTKALHVHDGIQPNGTAVPTMAGLTAKADVDLGNVTQEDITNLLARYGALTMNDNKSVSEAQRNNLWDKLGGAGAMDFGATVPENNVVTVDKDTHKMQLVDLSTSGAFGFGMDVKNRIVRAGNVSYVADRNCFVGVQVYTSGVWSGITYLDIDGLQVAQIGWGAGHGKGEGNWESSAVFPVAKGQTYKVRPGANNSVAIHEYGILPFGYKPA